MSDFNVWSRALKVDEMKDFTTCDKMLKGDLVDWDNSAWNLVNMTSAERNKDDLCIPLRPGHVLFPEKRNITATISICNQMRGKVSVVSSRRMQTELNERVRNVESCNINRQPRYWAGWVDYEEEGVYRDINSGEVLTKGHFSKWIIGKPNGDIAENCAAVQSIRDEWNDAPCTMPYCVFCELATAPDVHIRGLCDETHFDNRYSWVQPLADERHKFRGFIHSLLQWNNSISKWTLTSYKNKKVEARLDSYEYPFGTHEWTVYNEGCYGMDKNETNVILNINACDKNEFNCDDGNCVAMSQRCDRIINCPDRSDEINCDFLIFHNAYLKEIPPSPSKKSRMKTLEVKVKVNLLSILEITEVENSIELQFGLHISWLDSRLQMKNLQADKNLNTLTEAHRNKIWIPELVFHNTQSKQKTLVDKDSFVTIDRVNKFVRNKKSELQNTYIYKGSENPLTIARVYNVRFLCEFDMSIFPFDTQNCSIVMVMAGNSGKFVHLVIDQFKYLGPVDLTQYFVKSINSNITIVEDGTVEDQVLAVEFRVIFGRRILGTFLTTYLPTIIICIASFSTNYFKDFFFEAIVTVNLTALLVLTTLFLSVSNSLPKTAYIKMMDIWLIFNLFIPFAEVLLHTYINTYYDGDAVNHHGQTRVVQVQEAPKSGKVNAIGPIDVVDEKVTDRIRMPKQGKKVVAEKVVTWGIPLVFILFCIGYFSVGAYMYKA